MMKAIVYKEYGPPEVLRIGEIEKPEPKSNEVLIKIMAIEATKADCELRSFRLPLKLFWLPLRLVVGIKKPRRKVLGGYFSGKIESVGKDVNKFKPGDAVFGSAGFSMGAYAEFLCLSANSSIALKPGNMSHAEAAAVPLGGLNALHFLTRANVQRGEKVLVNGAGGSIGMYAVQIAKAMGAEVTAVDKVNKKEVLLQLGVDRFIDYHNEDFTEAGECYDVIFDMVVQSSYSKCIKILNPKGRYMVGNPRLSVMLRSVLSSMVTDKNVIVAFAAEKEQELLVLKEMVEAGKLKSIIDTIYPFEQAAEAHRKVETEERLGSIVISTGPSAQDN